MVEPQLSIAEKTFIFHGIQRDLREDGRSAHDYRNIQISLGIVSNANGSAQLTLGNTNVLVGVKAEVVSPEPSCPGVGIIQFFVYCSANASPIYEGKGGDSLSGEITNLLMQAYSSSSGIDMSSLCISAKSHVWKLNVDVVVKEMSGNLLDAVSLAVKAALFDLRLPVLKVIQDGDSTDIEITDDPYDTVAIDVAHAPLFVTLNKISHHHIVDATLSEEVCSLARLSVAVDPSGQTVFSKTLGNGSLQIQSVVDMLQSAHVIGRDLHRKLMSVLRKETQAKHQH